MKFGSVDFLALAVSLLLCRLAPGHSARPSSTRHLIRGGSPTLHYQDDTKDLFLEEKDFNEGRELGRVKARHDGGRIRSSTKGSKFGSSKRSKGSEGSKIRSKVSKGYGRHCRHSGPHGGIGCGDEDFGYIYYPSPTRYQPPSSPQPISPAPTPLRISQDNSAPASQLLEFPAPSFSLQPSESLTPSESLASESPAPSLQTSSLEPSVSLQPSESLAPRESVTSASPAPNSQPSASLAPSFSLQPSESLAPSESVTSESPAASSLRPPASPAPSFSLQPSESLAPSESLVPSTSPQPAGSPS